MRSTLAWDRRPLEGGSSSCRTSTRARWSIGWNAPGGSHRVRAAAESSAGIAGRRESPPRSADAWSRPATRRRPPSTWRRPRLLRAGACLLRAGACLRVRRAMARAPRLVAPLAWGGRAQGRPAPTRGLVPRPVLRAPFPFLTPRLSTPTLTRVRSQGTSMSPTPGSDRPAGWIGLATVVAFAACTVWRCSTSRSSRPATLCLLGQADYISLAKRMAVAATRRR